MSTQGTFAGGYDRVRLCKRGNVVVVSVNHRLNIFGYLLWSRYSNTENQETCDDGQLA
jgi:para-nitrobenzyl esterase